MEQADIKGEKLELHAQDIVGKREVARSNMDRIPRFSKGRRIETWEGKTAACMMIMELGMRENKTRQQRMWNGGHQRLGIMGKRAEVMTGVMRMEAVRTQERKEHWRRRHA